MNRRQARDHCFCPSSSPIGSAKSCTSILYMDNSNSVSNPAKRSWHAGSLRNRSRNILNTYKIGPVFLVAMIII
jgi:hypothetical protein